MNALNDFHARVEGIFHLLDTVAPGWDPERQPGQTPQATVPVGELSRSAIVLCVSYFEGFLKDLVDEAFDTLLATSIPCDRLPSRLRGRALMTHVRKLRESANPEAIWEAAVLVGSIGQTLNSASAVTADVLAREETKRELTSIEPANINEVLKALGDRDTVRGPMSIYGQRLKGLKQIRDNAVHGNELDLPSLAFADVSTYTALVLECATALSSRVDDLVGRLVASPASP